MDYKKYDAKEIEEKWQMYWMKNNTHKTEDNLAKPKFYCLDMFPYPSGDGLHVGHWRGYVLSDVISRYKRLKGFNVLHPMGWDAFGLPAENDAVKKGIHPQLSVQKNIKNFKRQFNEMASMYDLSREINTSNPDYYKYTQWIFVQMYKKGLAYRKKMPINWCPQCKTGLANEEVINGRCERCETKITKKYMEQWMLRITEYADRLLYDLDKLDWPEKVKKMQANWIGMSRGEEIIFPLINTNNNIKVFTTRIDTVFGVTFIVLAPEHPLVNKVILPEKKKEVEEYVNRTMCRSNIERMVQDEKKTGVFTGNYAVNPANNETIPILISDYVLMEYGTGAIMGVPAHDKRDYDFAVAFNIPVRKVIKEISEDKNNGILINSGPYTGMSLKQGKNAIAEELIKKGYAKRKVNYKLRDWVFSRQRYWGEPIPIIHCKSCKEVPVPEKDLPVKLPFVKKYAPSGTGESPLSVIEDWVNTTCPVCGRAAKRETNTMPQWAGSSWYFLRYCDPDNKNGLCERKKADYWLPVDLYIGGNEHAVLHLLYARFYTKFLYDIGCIGFDEPFRHLYNIGMINKDGYKMSKSKPNCVSSDKIVSKYGADTLRLYEMFIGPPDKDNEWNDKGIEGVYRFLVKVWNLAVKSIGNKPVPEPVIQKETDKLIKGVTQRIESKKVNTAISLFMSYINFICKGSPDGLDKENLGRFITLIAPFAPHFAEEIWELMGNKKSIFDTGRWPEYDSCTVKQAVFKIPVQINGKVKDVITIKKHTQKNDVIKKAETSKIIKENIKGKIIRKIIYVPDKVVNFVVK